MVTMTPSQLLAESLFHSDEETLQVVAEWMLENGWKLPVVSSGKSLEPLLRWLNMSDYPALGNINDRYWEGWRSARRTMRNYVKLLTESEFGSLLPSSETHE